MGECKKRCGHCCNHFSVNVISGPGIYPQKEWLEHHGCEVEDKGTHLKVTIPRACMHLGFEGVKSICKIYENRPEMCRVADCSQW